MVETLTTFPNDDERPTDAPKAPNPFDLDALRRAANYSVSAPVENVLTTVPCRKPGKQEFVRVRPGEAWQAQLNLLEIENDQGKEVYLVAPAICQELAKETRLILLVVAINRSGVSFLWPLKLAGPDDKPNSWYDSARVAAKLAEEHWVRVTSNMSSKSYETAKARVAIPEPEWPDKSLQELIEVCFRDRLIDSLEHPVVQQLWGLA